MTAAVAIAGGQALHVSLLGPVRVRGAGGRDLTPASRRSRVIIAYLSRAPGTLLPRQRLAERLWDRVGEPQARASLRQSLYEISRTFGPEGATRLTIERERVALTAGRIAMPWRPASRASAWYRPAAMSITSSRASTG